jgi:cytochrome P450
MMAEAALPEIDLVSPENWQNTPALLGDMVRSSPLARLAQMGTLVVLSADGVEEVLKDPRMLASGTKPLESSGIFEGPLYDWWSRIVVQSNPPIHARLRGLLNRAFTPRRAEAMRPRVAQIARELLEKGRSSPSLDVTGRFAHEIPVRIISEMLGVPPNDYEIFGHWSDEIGMAFATVITPEARQRIEKALSNLNRYVAELIAVRRATPEDDLISALIEAEEAGDRLSQEELLAMVSNLIFAGHDTTKGLISVTMKLLSDHPEQLEALWADPDLIPNAVEEILRFEPIAMMTVRTAAEDLEVLGEPVKEGESVILAIPAANRDPAVFDAPDHFDVTRPIQKHLSFGQGAHFCLGASLARVEAQEALRSVVETGCRVEVIDPPPRWIPYATIRGFESLRVALRN